MTDHEIERDLTYMKGKLFMYKKENHRVLKHEVTDKVVKVYTDTGLIRILKEDFKMCLNDFLPVEDTAKERIKTTAVELGATSPALSRPNTIITSLGNELTDVLRDNIDRLKKDRDFISQAVEINNQVKSIIDLARTEVELIKAMRN